MRVVLDTNIIISGLIKPAGVPGRLLIAWAAKRYILVSHPYQLDEYRDVTRRPRLRERLGPHVAGTLCNQIVLHAEMPGRMPSVSRSADPDDDFLLAIAEAGGADRLVSGDRRGLLDLGTHGGTRIVTARAFADELGI